MDAEEVAKYIAQIAFSGAEEFMGKYKSNDEKDQFIGHFGLGFYSAYMVAQKVEINTLSYKPGANPFSGHATAPQNTPSKKAPANTRYRDHSFHREGQRRIPRRTTLNEILKHYCSFLPYPVYLETISSTAKRPYG